MQLVRQPTPHSAHSLPADSPTSQQFSSAVIRRLRGRGIFYFLSLYHAS